MVLITTLLHVAGRMARQPGAGWLVSRDSLVWGVWRVELLKLGSSASIDDEQLYYGPMSR